MLQAENYSVVHVVPFVVAVMLQTQLVRVNKDLDVLNNAEVLFEIVLSFFCSRAHSFSLCQYL